ncbi:MAG: filamentous hemagglutinin N-terminal domain-containing protein [Candidatus Accumulibacter phosphatis]|uniref:Filamentous hemagglutinin N-terminal domain-containing protein n=1 Tax=Candidatus Accumulibacter contiguus TaxID=2954381 RepID=A0ABX1TFH9_9PROT|nr:filamentous hemagglutinin N-terminal domain-containing protein [Accumulibacter sp.]NMQ07843.1 filamentous hemagglutinin N-terminal domain-containing protein [Candidatus Accumulibacter contiguus]
MSGGGGRNDWEILAAVVGNNLFHSFSQFNIDTGQTADFTTSTSALANVISRVTGGSLSQINGTLQLTAAAGSAPAGLFLHRPGGCHLRRWGRHQCTRRVSCQHGRLRQVRQRRQVPCRSWASQHAVECRAGGVRLSRWHECPCHRQRRGNPGGAALPADQHGRGRYRDQQWRCFDARG